MTVDVLELDKVVQLRASDPEMVLFDKLEQRLNDADDVKLIKKSLTFETPIVEYRHKGIEFSLLFDEQESETFVAVVKPFDYRAIKNLIQNLA